MFRLVYNILLVSDNSTKILGSYIGKYNRIYSRKKTAKLSEQYDIRNIAKRLEEYKKYRQTILKEQKLKEQKLSKKVKRMINKTLYSKPFKPAFNPYLHVYQKLSSKVDPKLLEKYKGGNIYTYYEFKNLTLPRSDNTITAGQAWNALKKAWVGYKITQDSKNRYKDTDNAKIYASTIQKWCYLLETEIMPSFPDIGLTAEGFKYADILKKYFKGYEDEVTS